ncbi:hypothetical protein PHISCL_07746 [Aspergillus sclerotialis]|uniref:WHIM1 domain-containing protein n=1 Tax=Aspergillus sclerotialis TaxID=2070753 RepID=A0A3A2ZBD0_9EURO|nr:hypothetical protein PHISCL_07746 [Aspergillus sclerotialis]
MSASASDLSSLSSAPPTDEESPTMDVDEPVGITKYFKKESQSPPAKRQPSPPHEYVLADNPNIAFIVMFRARFHEVFPRSTPHFGPQDVERGVTEMPPGDHIERLLCAFLGLLLNRKKEVERNHYTRPLEEAIQTHSNQWPKEWEGRNPLRGGRTFATMEPEERLLLLKSLAVWSLSSSEAVQAKIKESYKQARHDDDLNQPLSVQPWGRDGLKRKYWLIEGLDDTHFRLYRESPPTVKKATWWSVAGNIPELKAVADKLDGEKSIFSRKLSEKIKNAIPRFEGSEEKRKRRDYRIARKAAFARPEPGFSLYEGRTRGKKLKYTYSEDEDIFSDDLPSTRKSTRNTSAISTPAEPAGPRFTASGRQIRTRAGGLYGEALLLGQRGEELAEENTGRPQRTRTSTRANGYTDFNMIDDIGEESDAQNSSGNEWHGDDEEDENDFEGDDAEHEISDDDSIANGERPSLIVHLKYRKRELPSKADGPGEESLAEKPETSTQDVPDRVGDISNTYAQESMANGAQETKPEPELETKVETNLEAPAVPEPASKPLNIPTTGNTDAEGSHSGLQNGANGV